MCSKVVVMIPTYNEAENIGQLLDEIVSIVPDSEILVVDDNSPDGTWKIVLEKANKNNHINLLHRKIDRGRGKAGVEGFKQAINRGADYIVEMDGDFSHDPRFIPDILNKAKEADVVLGSRYVKGGQDTRGRLRRFISKLAGLYIRLILGFNVKDPTSGYRCFTKNILQKINLDTIKANDPFIVTEILYKCYRANAKIKEVPIVFKDRERGKSKLGINILIGNLKKVLLLRIAG